MAAEPGPGVWNAFKADFRANAPNLADRRSAGAMVRAAARTLPTVRFTAGAAIFGPLQLGDRVRVGANAVVGSSFESDVVVAGAPAKIVRNL